MTIAALVTIFKGWNQARSPLKHSEGLGPEERAVGKELCTQASEAKFKSPASRKTLGGLGGSPIIPGPD